MVSNIRIQLILYYFKGSNNGGGYSLYAGEFADESFQIKHTEPGLIGMSKRGSVPHSNEC